MLLLTRIADHFYVGDLHVTVLGIALLHATVLSSIFCVFLHVRLRPEQRGTVERLNGLTSNLRVPTRTKPRLPPTKPETRGLVGVAGRKLIGPRSQRDVDGKIGCFRSIREIATQIQLLA